MRKCSTSYLTREQIKALLDLEFGQSLEGFRNQAIIFMLCSTGIRVSELVALRVRDIDFERSVINIRGQGCRERYVRLGWLTRLALETYFKKRVVQSSELVSGPVFTRREKVALSEGAIWSLVRRCGVLAGLGLHITPRILRLSYIAELIDSGAKTPQILEVLGLRHRSSLMRYRRQIEGPLLAR